MIKEEINIINEKYNLLIDNIGVLLAEARSKIAREVNTIMVDTYWNVGKYIVEYEQQGKERAEYGSNLLNRLSKDLTERYGKGFSKSNLLYIRKFYLVFRKSETVSHFFEIWKSRFPNLQWTHIFRTLRVGDETAIRWYF